jgi:hypothetical protein
LGGLDCSDGGGAAEGGGVWRIKSDGNTSKITNIVNSRPHLEGVITLTNDVQKWGPWAGKIITGTESEILPKIYAIATNGAVTSFSLGIGPEDFDLIPTNQDLYCADENSYQILKVSRSYFSSYVGDLLITQSGDGNPGVSATLSGC